MTNAWFKPKTHGYGAQPTSWEGWAVVIAYAVVFLGLLWRMVLSPLQGGTAQVSQVLLFVVITFAMTAVLVWIAKVKCDGEWRWRWGGDK